MLGGGLYFENATAANNFLQAVNVTSNGPLPNGVSWDVQVSNPGPAVTYDVSVVCGDVQ